VGRRRAMGHRIAAAMAALWVIGFRAGREVSSGWDVGVLGGEAWGCCWFSEGILAIYEEVSVW
jgi:hypothetical protein